MMADPIERTAAVAAVATADIDNHNHHHVPPAFDIDGASVMSRATMYSYTSKRRTNTSRGYKTDPPPFKSSSSSSVNSNNRQTQQRQSGTTLLS
jgi:hypothetical protein